MMSNSYLFTSESVSSGHPDKICDQISDLVLDEFLKLDPYARCGIETAATTNRVILLGEYRMSHSVCADDFKKHIEQKIREHIRYIGYEQEGFHWQTVEIQNYLHQQSQDIAQGVDETENKLEGAGDQGIMFGYASTQTKEYMPAAIYYSHRILENFESLRRTPEGSILGPDAKTQLTLEYVDEKPVRAHSIVISTQHIESASIEEVKKLVIPVIEKTLPSGWISDKTTFYINATGRFVIGGPDGDAGLTGRKIIVDTYGGSSPHGGGAFSGKDPTKVDRSAAYMARYLAKNIVAAGLCDSVTIQLSYCIGIAHPLSLNINPNSLGRADFKALQDYIEKNIDLTPKGIRTRLDLNKPIYLKTATYGHFGREYDDLHFSWEQLDLVEAFKAFLK
ncbi:MAG: methionine adenosyltransferase [Proteobacteria bacterium]|nr:methionine adenosyltransferase [Pseudomonadota bacterium]